MSIMISRQIEDLEKLFAEYRSTNEYPCGGSVYFEEFEETSLPNEDGKPWRVHYCDGGEDEYFRGFDEAAIVIESYVEEMRSDPKTRR